jgi:methylated-DNA-[protein]-cysteine S-methyltransferase
MSYIETTLESPIGPLHLAERDGVLVALQFERDHYEAVLRARYDALPEPGTPRSLRALEAYLAGDVMALEALPAEPGGTSFQAAVWAALRSIPVGATASYADIARAIGSPRAVRAVGAANGQNPVAIVIPCHRVIRSDGDLCGYGGGLPRKRWLLSHEGNLPRELWG